MIFRIKYDCDKPLQPADVIEQACEYPERFEMKNFRVVDIPMKIITTDALNKNELYLVSEVQTIKCVLGEKS